MLSAYLTAAYPETTAWFLLIFLLIASARGAFSASTKFCASDWISIPEPAPILETIFAAELVAGLDVADVPVLLDEPELVEVAGTAVVDDVDDETLVTMICWRETRLC